MQVKHTCIQVILFKQTTVLSIKGGATSTLKLMLMK